MTDIVRFETAEGVGTITLNRPDRLNALDDAMHPAIEEAVIAAATADDVRVILLTGAGRAFCAGADMVRLNRLIASRGADFDLPRPGRLQRGFAGVDGPPETLSCYTWPLGVSKPVIGAINGASVGAGFILAACCDIRFISERGFFNAAFPQRGLIAESGLAWLLPRLVGHGLANDILLSGRRIPAEEAVRIGLASQLFEPDALLPAATAYAREMATTAAPRALRQIKRQLQDAWQQSYADATGESYDLLRDALAHDDFQEGVRSFEEKRPPQFIGR
ncbi:MAG: enoyl-CoA hydratase-related protein [Sphingobium sp.]